MSVKAEIFLMWTNVARTNVTWANVPQTVGICSECSQEPPLKFHQNRVSNSGDIAVTNLIVSVVVGGEGWGGLQSHFHV